MNNVIVFDSESIPKKKEAVSRIPLGNFNANICEIQCGMFFLKPPIVGVTTDMPGSMGTSSTTTAGAKTKNRGSVMVTILFGLKRFGVFTEVIKLPIFWGIKQYKSMVVLRDFPKIMVHCLGWCHTMTPVLGK